MSVLISDQDGARQLSLHQLLICHLPSHDWRDPLLLDQGCGSRVDIWMLPAKALSHLLVSRVVSELVVITRLGGGYVYGTPLVVWFLRVELISYAGTECA